MDGLWTVLGQIKDLATLVALLCLVGLGYLHIQMIKANREDRDKLLDMMGKMVEAINGVKNYLSAMSGKPFQ